MAARSRKKGAARAQFKLMSPDIRPNGPIAMEQVFNGFGCSGQNISPALGWSGAPADTKTFALLVHDPDAPTGGAGWWHWLVVNIPAGATQLRKDAGKADGSNLPFGCAQIDTDFGGPGWGGPCPPVGDKPTATTSRCTRSRRTASTWAARAPRSPATWSTRTRSPRRGSPENSAG